MFDSYFIYNPDAKLFASSGILNYTKVEPYNEGTIQNPYRLTLDVDKELARYYRSLIPKCYLTNLPRYSPHITVVRPEKETPINMEYWERYQGEEIPFYYDHQIFSDETYYWLNAFSDTLENIRSELGLPISSMYTRPPTGYVKCFHITIANKKF